MAPSEQGKRLAAMATKLRRLERAYQVAIDTEKRNALEQAVEAGEMDEYKARDKLNSAHSAWKEANKMFANQNVKALSEDGAHQNYVWESAAKWMLSSATEDVEFVVPYLDIWGYEPEGAESWRAAPAPRLTLQLAPNEETPAHEEHGGHTWYMIDCHVQGMSEAAMLLQGSAEDNLLEVPLEQRQLRWRAPRRLVQLRECVHDPIKAHLGENYSKYFGNTPFAHFGAPPGTSNRVAAWLVSLAELVNSGNLPPSLVARTLVFLRGPPMPEQKAAREAAEAAEAAEAIETAACAEVPGVETTGDSVGIII